MAKDGKKAGKSGKSRGARIPKEIGGVKIPKELRRTGEALIDHVNSPAGRQAITGAMTTAMMGAATIATAAMAKKAAERTGTAEQDKPEEHPSKQDAPKQGMPGVGDPQAFADAIGTAAEALIGRFFAKR